MTDTLPSPAPVGGTADGGPPHGTAPGSTRRVPTWVRWPSARVWIMLVVAVIIGYLALVPIGYLVWGTFWDDQGFTLDAFRRAYSSVGLGRVTWNSAIFTVGVTAMTLVIGTILAFFTERTDIPFKRFIFAATLVPMVIPSILYTIAWIFLASPNIGILNHVLIHLPGAPHLNVYTMPGMIVVQSLDSMPLVYLIMVAAFRSMDPSLEESAMMSGARLPAILVRITLPLARPALYGAGLIMAVRGVEAFEVPALLGMPVHIWLFTSRIWRSLQFPPDYGEAGAYSLTLLVLAMVGVLAQMRLTRRGRGFQTVTGKGFRPRALLLGRWRWFFGTLVFVYFAVAIILPTLVLLYMSFQSYYAMPSFHRIAHSTLTNYSNVIHYPESVTAFRNSFVISAASALIVMILAALASWIVIRTRIRGRAVLDLLAFVPLLVPGLVLGVALMFVYLRMPIPVYGTALILLIAYVTKFLPYGMRFASASTFQISSELEESAQVSGATWSQTFRRINMPLLMPGLVVGWLYVLLTAVRELSASLLLYSPGNQVLSVLIWEQYTNGKFNQLAALGMLLILVLVVLVVVVQKFGARFGVDTR